MNAFEEPLRLPIDSSPRSAHGDRVDQLTDALRRELGGYDAPHLVLTRRVGRLGAILEEEMASCLGELGLTRGGYGVLTALRAAGEPFELRPIDLRDRVLLSSGGMSNVLARLTELGLVERRPDANDGRSSLVRLTEKGFATTEEAVTAWARRQDDFYRRVTPANAEAAVEALREIMLALGDRQSNRGR